MSSFLGEYEISMDAKGRFLMPSAFRKQIPEGQGDSFVINRGFNQYLTLYTKEAFDLLSEKVSRLNDFNQEVLLFKRLFLRGATLIQLDSAGRVLLPKNLQEHAQLKKELVFSCQGDKVEIWDKQIYHDYINAHEADFAALAGKLLGNNIIDPFGN